MFGNSETRRTESHLLNWQMRRGLLLLVPAVALGVQLPTRPPCCPACRLRLQSPMLLSEKSQPSEAAVAALRWYKQIISPLLPPGCRFIPTCSEYGQQCFEQFTVPQSIVLIVWRLFRCNPLHFPGYGFGIDEPVWPPCAYWAGNGQVRTYIDDEISRARANGELDDGPLPFDPLAISDGNSPTSAPPKRRSASRSSADVPPQESEDRDTQ